MFNHKIGCKITTFLGNAQVPKTTIFNIYAQKQHKMGLPNGSSFVLAPSRHDYCKQFSFFEITRRHLERRRL